MHRVWRRVLGKCLPALWVALWLPVRSGEGKNGRLACRWLDVEGVARGRLATTTPAASHIPFMSTARWCSRGLIEEIKKVELIGPRREIWREGVSALACKVAWHGSRQPHPICSRDRTGCTEFTGSTGQSQAVDEEDQHSAFSISTSISMREGQTLDAVGSWEGGKLCSINSHACLCMVYPNRDIPKWTFPIGNMNIARILSCTARTVIRSKNTARLRAGGHLEISISISIINMFGLGRPFLVAVIKPAARSREGSFTRSNISINTTLPICQFGSHSRSRHSVDP
jgi:hypothetical protein